MAKLHDTSCSHGEPLWGASVKVHLFCCNRDVKILRIHRIALNFTSFCLIGDYILKVIISKIFSSR